MIGEIYLNCESKTAFLNQPVIYSADFVADSKDLRVIFLHTE